jgi:hypothetical protein
MPQVFGSEMATTCTPIHLKNNVSGTTDILPEFFINLTYIMLEGWK